MRTIRFRPLLAAALLAALPLPAAAQRFTIEQVIAPAFPFDLVASAGADRIAWIAYERTRPPARYRGRTFCASSPLRPWPTSNSTVWPSSSDL